MWAKFRKNLKTLPAHMHIKVEKQYICILYVNHQSKSVLYPAELSSTLMEKMQAQEMMSGLRIPEMDELGQFFRSLPTSTLVGIGALTAVLAYWLATRPRPIKPPCSLLHQSEEVPVSRSTHSHAQIDS